SLPDVAPGLVRFTGHDQHMIDDMGNAEDAEDVVQHRPCDIRALGFREEWREPGFRAGRTPDCQYRDGAHQVRVQSTARISRARRARSSGPPMIVCAAST